MAELIAKFVAHLRGMWRFRWPALIVAWLVAMAGWVWTYTLPNQYETTSQVYVDTESALRPLLQGLSTEVNVMNQVELMTRALLSRTNLEDVARETDLDLRATTAREQQRLIERMQAKISITDRGNNVYTITFRDRDPEMTRDVVKSLLSSFVGDTLKDQREDSEQAMSFLSAQIEDYETRLNEAEARLAEFKKRNVGMMPGSTGTYYERLKAAMDGLGQVEQMIALKERTRQELINQLRGEEPTFGLVTMSNAPAATTGGCSNDGEIGLQEQRLSQLRLIYTEKHPDVIGTIETIELLQARCDDEMGAVSVGAGDGVIEPANVYNPLDLNPVYQGLKLNLSATEVELVELKARRSQQRGLVASLQKSVDSVPEVEAQLARLNRDYDVTKRRYDTLLERMENARMGSTADSSTSDIKFRIIDAPTLPVQPIGPNRLVFLIITLVVGLGAGLAFSFVMDQVRPVYITRRDLGERTGLPVLGAIGVVLMPHQRVMVRMQTLFFAVGLLALLAAFAVAIIFQESFVEMYRLMQLRAS